MKVNKNENYRITIMSKISSLATAWNKVPGNVFCLGSGYHGKKAITIVVRLKDWNSLDTS